MRLLLLTLLPIAMGASCGRPPSARRTPNSSTPAHPAPTRGGNARESEPAAQGVACDFSSFNPLVRPTSGGPAISKPAPPYPREAKEKGVGGVVRVKILINAESGRVEQACVTHGDGLLAEAARGAALRARFSPYLGGDKYVKEHYRYIESVITYNFSLQ